MLSVSGVWMVYHVQSEQISLGKRIARTAVVVLVTGVAQYLWFYRSGKWSHGEDWLIDSVVLGMVTFFLDSRRREYDLELDDEMIRVRSGSLGIGNGRVRRGRIRYLHESIGGMFREPALRLSEHGRISSFFVGRVWIPASLPEYEQLKAKAMSWMEIG
jgi:hypothetical protein